MSVYYSALNLFTVSSSYPLHRIYDIFDQLKGSSYFSKINVRMVYHQIRLENLQSRSLRFEPQGTHEHSYYPTDVNLSRERHMALIEIICKEYSNIE